MGNIDTFRDWGHAKDYVEMQWLMLQQKEPEDYVIATGHQESVRRFIEITAKVLGWGGIKWNGKGIDEIGIRTDTGQTVIRIDPRYFRPSEVETLLGDPSKAHNRLGWKPKTCLEDLINEMVTRDKEDALKESVLSKEGFNINVPFESPPSK